MPGDAWDRWWATPIDREPLGPVAPVEPRLAALATAVDEEARRWEDVNVTFTPPYHPGRVSTWLMDHRLAAPVQVLLVGIGGVWHAQVGPCRFLVSVGFQALEAQA